MSRIHSGNVGVPSMLVVRWLIFSRWCPLAQFVPVPTGWPKPKIDRISG